LSPDTDTDTPASDEAPTTDDTLRDEVLESMRDRLVAELGDAALDSHIGVGRSLWVRVTVEAWRTAGQVARDHLGCRWFDFLSAIDWLPSPYGRYEDSELDVPFPPAMPERSSVVTGYTGGDTRFQVLASVAETGTDLRVLLKADVPDDDPRIGTWIRTYAGAAWHERETHEMFGISFEGNPDLRHIYLPTGFEGHPLRKEFPLLARVVKPWPGIVDVEPMPGGDDDDATDPEAGEA
jgi:NADH-quinone oxidoreductase subunit C